MQVVSVKSIGFVGIVSICVCNVKLIDKWLFQVYISNLCGCLWVNYAVGEFDI